MKIKRNFIILLTGCLLFMIYGCSAAQEDLEIADTAEEEIKVTDEGQIGVGTEKASPPVMEPIEAQAYQDGVYTGVSKKVEGKGYSEVTIEIVNNNITKASIVEYYGNNKAKDPDTYKIPVQDGEDILLRKVFITLESNIVEKDTYDVDIITGATESCYKVIQATYSALQEAQKKENEKDIIEENEKDIEDILESEPCDL
jgi:major membrane immunogen (membrane-anchored lipoprotein)